MCIDSVAKQYRSPLLIDRSACGFFQQLLETFFRSGRLFPMEHGSVVRNIKREKKTTHASWRRFSDGDRLLWRTRVTKIVVRR